MKILGKHYDDKALGMGAALLGVALIIPTISEPLINFFVGLRDKVSSTIKK